jgi:molybdopterin synthase sulfur carrier subunit
VPRVSFTSALQRFLAVFAERPALRGYVLDDQGAVRRHVAIYVGGDPVRDRTGLSDPVGVAAEIYVLQALTGG